MRQVDEDRHTDTQTDRDSDRQTITGGDLAPSFGGRRKISRTKFSNNLV